MFVAADDRAALDLAAFNPGAFDPGAFDRRQKPSDQCQGGVFRLGEFLPQVLARVGVTQESPQKEVAAVRLSRSPHAGASLRDGIRELAAT